MEGVLLYLYSPNSVCYKLVPNPQTPETPHPREIQIERFLLHLSCIQAAEHPGPSLLPSIRQMTAASSGSPVSSVTEGTPSRPSPSIFLPAS